MKHYDLPGKIFTAYGFFVISGLFSVATGNNYWPHFMGPHHNGTAAGEVLDTFEISTIWEANVGTGFSSITVVDDFAYTIGNRDDTDTVYCLNVKDGQVIWKYAYPCKLDPNQYEGGPNTTPSYHDQKLYILSKEGHLFCFEAKSGKILWSGHTKEFGIAPPKFGFSSSPFIHKDLVIFNMGTGGAALNKKTGKVVWKSGSTEDDKCYATPFPFLIGEKNALAFFVGEKLLAIDPASGSEFWQIPWKSKYDVHPAAPTFFNDKIFVSAGVNKECALFELAGEKPRKIWENKNLRCDLLNAIYAKGSLFGIDGSASRRAKLVCLDAETGTVQWENKDIGFASLLMIDGKLILLNDQGVLRIAEANPRKYVELKRKEILKYKCWTPPSVAAGRLYARNASGDVVCVNLVGN